MDDPLDRPWGSADLDEVVQVEPVWAFRIGDRAWEKHHEQTGESMRLQWQVGIAGAAELGVRYAQPVTGSEPGPVLVGGAIIPTG